MMKNSPSVKDCVMIFVFVASGMKFFGYPLQKMERRTEYFRFRNLLNSYKGFDGSSNIF